MKFLKTLGYAAAADILSLFVNLTLAGSSMTFMKIISAVCTVGILFCFMISHAVRCAKDDCRSERISKTATPALVPAIHGITAMLIPLVSWLLLFVSKATEAFDFYRFHKLINGYFLQIYNLINQNAETSALSMGQIGAMAALIPVPMIVFIAAYFISYSREKGNPANE